MSYRNHSIQKPYLILCEGTDDQNFLISYLNSSALSDDKRFSEQIQVLKFNGTGNLSKFLNNLKNLDHFSDVKNILVIRDADQNSLEAENSIKHAYLSNGFPVPEGCSMWKKSSEMISTAYTLFPSCSRKPENGTLEDLCWQILAENNETNLKAEVNEFVRHVKETYHTIDSHEHKSRLHSYFSVNEKFISMKVGEAATAGAFDWNHSKLLPLKELIAEGFNI